MNIQSHVGNDYQNLKAIIYLSLITSNCKNFKSFQYHRYCFLSMSIINGWYDTGCGFSFYWYPVFDSRIIHRMICESMLFTKMEKLPQCTVVLVNQTALWALCFFFNKVAHNLQAWPVVSCFNSCSRLHDIYNKLVVFVSNFYVQWWWIFGSYNGMIATSEE